MKYPKLRELLEAIKALIKGPYTNDFPNEPYYAEHYRGKPEYSLKDCVGCGTCAVVCPSRAIEVTEKIKEDGVSTRKLTLRHDTCIFCGQCVANCITEKGIRQTHEYDLAVFNRELAVQEIEKELILCGCCGGVIGTKEHLVFLARKLGLLASGNPLLILVSQEELKLITEDARDKDVPSGRGKMFRIVCPKCRHQAVLTDIWGK